MLTGCVPDEPDSRDWLFEESKILGARPITGAETFDYRAHDSPRVQISQSCVGHAVAAAAYLCMAIAGTPIRFPSSLLAYTGARLLRSPPPLIDAGSSFRLALQWGQDKGMVAEERWPEVADAVNEVPPLDVFQEGECARVDAYYRIPDGIGASAGLKEALRRGYCPVFAMMVDEAYMSLGTEVYSAPGGKVVGGHGQVALGYEADTDAFLVRTPWGPGFADGGYARIAASFMDRLTFDKWVIQVAPEVR